MHTPSHCARAATAEEARFRVDYPNSRPRSTKIVALDDAAATVIHALEDTAWQGARFLTLVGRAKGVQGLDAIPPDLDLRDAYGQIVGLRNEIRGADAVVMIATAGSPAEAEAASIIGRACGDRGIMTTAIVVEGEGRPAAGGDTLAALRPHARMLVVASGADYIPDMLAALRA